MNETSLPRRPHVTLVGAGPGDPDLLTIAAVKALRRATVVLVDDLVGAGVLRYVRRSARIVHVGKRGGRESTPQAFIHRRLIAEAARGEVVVRLKGGDPFVFGRGGEEVDALRDAGMTVDVISGITAGIAGPASIGIPVTDRRHTPGVAFVTGHCRDGGGSGGPDWAALARCGLTIVVYMGLGRCGTIVAELLAGGMAADTPAAVVSDACTASTRHAATVLRDLPAVVASGGFEAPALLVIGDVVAALATLATAVQAGPRSMPVERSEPAEMAEMAEMAAA